MTFKTQADIKAQVEEGRKEINAAAEALENWWLIHHDDSRFFNEVMRNCQTIAARMQRKYANQPQAGTLPTAKDGE